MTAAVVFQKLGNSHPFANARSTLGLRCSESDLEVRSDTPFRLGLRLGLSESDLGSAQSDTHRLDLRLSLRVIW
jgi:hypothetical protein